jgi:hypothetical protein
MFMKDCVTSFRLQVTREEKPCNRKLVTGTLKPVTCNLELIVKNQSI